MLSLGLIMKLWKAGQALGPLETEAEQDTKMPDNTTKPGWKTSEFWLHVLAYAPAVAAIFLPPSAPALIAISAVAHLSAAAYTFSRSGVKIGGLLSDSLPAISAAGDQISAALIAAAQTPPPPAPAPAQDTASAPPPTPAPIPAAASPAPAAAPNAAPSASDVPPT